MTNFIDDYVKRTQASKLASERAQKVIPAGVGSAIQFWAPYPIFVKESKGAYVWDLDGNRYIDYSMCYAAMIAGHANPIVAEVVKKQLDKGTLYGLGFESGTLLAEEIHRRYPVMEMMRFTQSGVEATTAAVRLARTATQKNGIFKNRRRLPWMC